MGKNGRLLYAVKRVFSCESNENRRKYEKTRNLASPSPENPVETHSTTAEVKLIEAEIEQNRHAYSVALATAAAAEAAAAAANAAAEVVRLTAVPHYTGKSKEEIAAVRIQTTFRGYLARRALKALRGLVRLKSLVGGQAVKRQAASTLKCLQTQSRVLSEIRARRLRMSEQNSAIQRQMQQKREIELERFRVSDGEDWDDTMQSKEEVDASIQRKQEAAIRRERGLAYAYTHQQKTWRNSSNLGNQTFMDPNNPHWGWSWLERLMASHPDKEAQKQIRQSPSTPNSKSGSKLRLMSPRGTATRNSRDDDTKSINSVQSDRCRRHSVAGSSVRDDESLVSSPAVVQGYMAMTESAKARSRLASPLGGEKTGGGGGSAKKRLSFSGSPGGPRRHSGPPRLDFRTMKDVNTES